MNKKALLTGTAIATFAACTAQASLITNGDLETEVVASGSAIGSTEYTLASPDVLENGVASAFDENQWVLTNVTRGFEYNATGGNGGGGAFTQDTPQTQNGRNRGVVFFANDASATTGSVDLAMDVFFTDAAGADLDFSIELYAWNSGQIGAGLSVGGGTGSWNQTNLNDAVSLLDTSILASSVADSTWSTVTFSSGLDLGIGYDFYAWRIGVRNAANTDAYGFDNLTVTSSPVPEPSSFALLAGLVGLGFTVLRRK